MLQETGRTSNRPMHDYSYLPELLQEPDYGSNQMTILRERYLAKKPDGTTETTKEMLWRIAYAVARAELRYPTETSVVSMAYSFYDIMVHNEFLPNTPCLINAGRPLGELSACYVLDVPDSIEGIGDAVKAQMCIQRGGGGTGFSFSELRHSGAAVGTTGKEASGPVSFMKIFNAATDTIKQGGVRRGANMGVLRVNHPDIFDFMRCKKELDNENLAHYNRLVDSKQYTQEQLAHLRQEMLQRQFNNFNISIGISQEFMVLVEVALSMQHNDIPPFYLLDNEGSPVSYVDVLQLWEAIVEGAWQNGEPGVLFLDHPEINPLPGLGKITSSNPCAEQFLHGGDSCNLGSINVAKFYHAEHNMIDWVGLERAIRISARFLDNVIDENEYAVPEIREMVQSNRRIGLGIMGFADLLILLGIDYGTPEAQGVASLLMRFIQMTSIETSITLGRERGSFPNKHLSVFANDNTPRRNAASTTIAPTGTISMIAGCSFGCEPHFAIAYTKHVMKDAQGRPKNLFYVVPEFERRAMELGLMSDDLLQRIADNGGSVKGLGLPEKLTKGFAVTGDVSATEHVAMLCAFQEFTCNAVSKTCNMPNSATRKEVSDAILQAWRGGAKGMTVYRDGSRSEQVVTLYDSRKPKHT